jgi:molybdate transport system substrate-binding protein
MRKNPDIAISPNFASSGTLQQQIENGAPVDVFISAGSIQMGNLQKAGLLIDETRVDLLNNTLVLIVTIDNALNITGFTDLATDKIDKLAVGDPRFVPAGTYAGMVFDDLGITDSVKEKIVLASDVRQVLTFVESGNVDAGVVYSTDALTSDKVTVVATAPAGINAQVVYPAAVIKTAGNVKTAREYIDFLSGVEADAIFEKYGFAPAAN